MIVCLIDWLKVSEIWNFWSWMRGNEMTFPNFHPCIYDLHEFKLFHHKTLEWRWYDFFHLNKWKKSFEKIWIPFGNISNSKTLCNSMIFRREDKMTSSIIWNMSWKLQRIKLKVIGSILKLPFKFRIIWILFKIIFLLKINKWK